MYHCDLKISQREMEEFLRKKLWISAVNLEFRWRAVMISAHEVRRRYEDFPSDKIDSLRGNLSDFNVQR